MSHVSSVSPLGSGLARHGGTVRAPKGSARSALLGLLLGGLSCFVLLLPCRATAQPVPLELIRITPEQYQQSIRDVFGASIRIPDNPIEPGLREEGLLAVGGRKLTISSAGLERYESLARDIAAQVVEPRRRAVLVQCNPASESRPDRACATQFIRRVGLLLFRRPLDSAETRSFLETHTAAARALRSFDAGLSAALVRMLVDPNFLFRVERTEESASAEGSARLDAYAMAARLSFFFWNTTPDPELLEAARTGSLLTAAGLERQVDRLLDSPRLESGVRALFSDMLGFDAFATLAIDTTLYPAFTKQVRDDAGEQTLRTLVELLIHRDGDYRDIFVTRDTYLTPSLAAVYNVPLARSQELGGAVPWSRYRFPDDSPYVGILSHVSFLSLHSHAARSSPTLRGKALRERILCQRVPPPPGNIDFTSFEDPENPMKTARDRLAAHNTNPVCAGCHRLTDPGGLALEPFDTAGAFRTMENGVVIDPSGQINGRKFDGPAGLAQILRDTPAVTGCLVNRAFSYGVQRKPQGEELEWLKQLQAQLLETGVRLRPLLRSLATDPRFFTIRSPEPVPTARAETSGMSTSPGP